MSNEEISQALADKIIEYLNMCRDNKEIDCLKGEPKNKQGVISEGIIKRMLVVIKKISQEEKAINNIKHSEKTKEQTLLDFQRNKYKNLIALVSDVADPQLLELKEEYKNFIITNSKKYETVPWLNKWTNQARDINFATHVGKLTHSSSKSSSILDTTVEKNDRYLTTNQLSTVEIDTASSNTASLPIANILKLTVNGVSVLDYLKRGETTFLNKIADNDAVAEEWANQLKQSLNNKRKQSYFLSKQIYFPTKARQYHLLMPLTSSSLVHTLHIEHKKHENEEQKKARSQKNKQKYSAIITCTYPNRADLRVTTSNHSNASPLNANREGVITLLPAMPPQWKSQMQSYINKTSIFDKTLVFELKDEIKELRNYLLLIKNKSLSISEPKRNAAVINKLQAISSHFFDYLERINDNEAHEGWTIKSKLPQEQQLAFEPRREDDIAQELKISKLWQKTLSQTYGRWLNQQLSQKTKLTLTTIHATLWSDCFLFELREMVATQEVAL